MYRCNYCQKPYLHRQSLWKQKHACKRYTPPNSYNSNDATVGEKRKVDGKYSMFSDTRFPSIAMSPSCKRQRTKHDIVGYSDDETEEK